MRKTEMRNYDRSKSSVASLTYARNIALRNDSPDLPEIQKRLDTAIAEVDRALCNAQQLNRR